MDDVVELLAELERLKKQLAEAEDFRAEIVIEAFTAPDADWNTILDSLRARLHDLVEARAEADANGLRLAEENERLETELREHGPGEGGWYRKLEAELRDSRVACDEKLRLTFAELDEARAEVERLRAQLRDCIHNEGDSMASQLQTEVERLRAALESTECPTPIQRDGGGFIACGACPRCQALEGSASAVRG